jgi:hypothetical protein
MENRAAKLLGIILFYLFFLLLSDCVTTQTVETPPSFRVHVDSSVLTMLSQRENIFYCQVLKM